MFPDDTFRSWIFSERVNAQNTEMLTSKDLHGFHKVLKARSTLLASLFVATTPHSGGYNAPCESING